MEVVVVVFPGTTGHESVKNTLARIDGCEVKEMWHDSESFGKPDLVILPPGCSFNDFLRPGGLAKVSKASGIVRAKARTGTPVLGIGNGFQLLCELELLPGCFFINMDKKLCNDQTFIVKEGNIDGLTSKIETGSIFNVPMASLYGRFYLDKRSTLEVRDNDLVAFSFSNARGNVNMQTTFNDCTESIAGLINKKGNVLGVLPHIDKAYDPLLGSTDGVELMKSILDSLQ